MKERARAPKAATESHEIVSHTNRHQDEGVLVFPASVIQQQFWLINQLHPDSPAYNIPSVFRLRGPLNPVALEESINEIIHRHEAFRTTFSTVHGEVFQIIARRLRVNVAVTDLSRLSESDLDDEVQRLIHIEVARPFDLGNGPLLRVRLLRLSDNEHVMLIITHHIIFDLHTKDQFARELSILYEAYVAHKRSPLAEPAHQYSDYAVWQRKWIEGEQFLSMVSYWKEQLGQQSDFLDLPTDRQRPAVQSLRGAEQPLELSRRLTNALKQFSRQEEVNIFVTLLSAYLVLLNRYSGKSDITVGVPLTNRRRAEHKDIMGCFVNILPISFSLYGDPDFRDVMRHVRKKMLGAHRHQEVPYESIVRELQPKRDASYNPLFQVAFTFEPPMKLELHGLKVESLSTHREASQLEIFVYFWESDEAICLLFEYNTDLFDDGTIARFVDNYRALLKAITVSAGQPISSLPILAESERKLLLEEWNRTKVAYPETSLIHQLFEEQVDQTPDAVAVVFEDAQLTYKELNQRANQLAHFLRALGIEPEVPVGICMERSAQMVVALLGILKAGGAYVPLDPEFPKERVAYMLEHSQVPLLLTQKRLMTELPENNTRVICLEAEWEEISRQSDEIPVNETTPDNLSYVIYTSGSTGKPKGVQVTHGAAVNFLTSMAREPGLTDQDVLLAVTTLSFDISLSELFLPLIVGAKTVVVTREVASDGKQLLEVLRKSGVTVMQATPATWRLLIAAGWKDTNYLKVLCGGEALPTDLASELVERAGSVWNMYGPTETTVWSGCYHLTESTDGTIPIGRPIANTQIYILDRQMELVPIGVPGEIYIGGAGLARGYLRQPEKTRERFVPDPFSNDKGGRLYRTGDFGRYLKDGNIEYICRIDNQVKVRGFRIELGEIEAVLVRHPQVKEVAVAAREDTFGTKYLVGYVVPTGAEKPLVESLRSFLHEKLPYYMVPGVFVTLKALPLTPNGKVDRKALPEPDRARPDMKQTFVSPSTRSERTLAEIWCHILCLDEVGVHDNFFDLGGNSLHMTQVHSKLRERFQRDLPMLEMFKYPTISALAHYINRGESDSFSFQQMDDRAEKFKEGRNRLEHRFRQRRRVDEKRLTV